VRRVAIGRNFSLVTQALTIHCHKPSESLSRNLKPPLRVQGIPIAMGETSLAGRGVTWILEPNQSGQELLKWLHIHRRSFYTVHATYLFAQVGTCIQTYRHTDRQIDRQLQVSGQRVVGHLLAIHLPSMVTSWHTVHTVCGTSVQPPSTLTRTSHTTVYMSRYVHT
jgi:hypothetical protein